jgi:hemoglobin-like flavoprotein
MGGTSSAAMPAPVMIGVGQKLGSGVQEMNEKYKGIVKLMMPVYYNDSKILSDEQAAAAFTWQMILTNTAPEFLEKRKTSQEFRMKFSTSIMYFSHVFFERLFNIHPLAKDLFKDMKSQGKFLVKMISLSLSEPTDKDKFETTLLKLAEIHNERGVKAVECKSRMNISLSFVSFIMFLSVCDYVDGVVGEVLLWAIRATIGPDAFNPTVHIAWIKIYSRMLRTMVPVAISFELKNGSGAQAKRFFSQSLGGSGQDLLLEGLASGTSAKSASVR